MIPTISQSARKLLCKKCVARFPLKKPAEFRKEMRKKRLGEQEQERLTKKGARAAVREVCVSRAKGFCECGCGFPLTMSFPRPLGEMDHFHGRRQESVETCWLLLSQHHKDKTENRPTRMFWDAKFESHCIRHGYPFKPRFGGRPKADARNEPSNALAIASARESR